MAAVSLQPTVASCYSLQVDLKTCKTKKIVFKKSLTINIELYKKQNKPKLTPIFKLYDDNFL